MGGCAHEEPAPQAQRPQASAPMPVERDWRWVQGAVFVPTNCVNEAQQWDEYDPAINDRELRYASVYGFNVVRVYLHYLVYLKKKAALLASIEDFLARADKYGIKTEFVFFDDCWNQPPPDLLSADYRYPAPIPGVHNSRWLVCPGEEVRQHYQMHAAGLKAYVQDIVSAHRADPRVAFWEIYNEPGKSPETLRLERDALLWIKQTGSTIPATATDKEFSGGPFSDFDSWHQYGSYALGGDEHTLCTECMNRQGQTVPGVVQNYRGKVGFIVWELGIGRDNCRFAWADNRDHPRSDEPPMPFHGVVYPDGHPWSLGDARALLGPERYARTNFFQVSYFKDAKFTQLAKTSLTPLIDFDLVDEAGAGSPDASAGIPRENFSLAYQGQISVPVDGEYTFTVASDGPVRIELDGAPVLISYAPGKKSGKASLGSYKKYSVNILYSHATGPAGLHVHWSGPGFADRPLEPASHPADL
jgi:hypothetical protein